MKKAFLFLLISALLAAELLSASALFPITAYATQVNTTTDSQTESDESESEDETDETSETESAGPSNELLETDIVTTDDILLYSTACVVMDIDTGAILYSKNRSQQLYPASTTKILTTLLALERAELTDIVTFSEEAINSITWEYSNMELEAGDCLTLEEALYGIMLASANEAAYGVAEFISGSSEQFALEMTEYAISLGCRMSNFTNASGIEDEEHYTTAKDLAIIARAAAQNEDFLTITGTVSYDINNINFKSTEVTDETTGETTIVAETYQLYNHHRMVNGTYSYTGCYGGKTGYTSASGNTLVTYVERDGVNLVCVILGCYYGYTYAYDDTATALDYCFENFDTLLAQALEAEALLDYPDMCLRDWYLIGTSPLSAEDGFYPNMINAFSIYLDNLGVYNPYAVSETEDTADSGPVISTAEAETTVIDTSLLPIILLIMILILIFLTLLIYYLARCAKRRRRRRHYENMRRQRLSEDRKHAQHTVNSENRKHTERR